MRRKLVAVVALTLGTLAAFGACKSNSVVQNQNTTNNFMRVGPEGATVDGPDGAQVSIPPGALSKAVEVGIAVADPKEYPPLPSGVSLVGKIYAFLPHGQFFDIDANMVLPAPANAQFNVWHAEQGGAWAGLTTVTAKDGKVRFRVSQFSYFAIAASTEFDAGPWPDAVPTPPPDTAGSTGSGPWPDSAGSTPWPDASCPLPVPSAPADGTATGLAGTFGGSPIPSTAVYATSVVRPGTSGVDRSLVVSFTNYSNVCGYSSRGLAKANTKSFLLRLKRTSPGSLPPDFTPGTYSISSTSVPTDAGTYQELVMVEPSWLDASCASPAYAGSSSGTITLTAVSAASVSGSFNITGSEPASGSFSAPICGDPSGATLCCAP